MESKRLFFVAVVVLSFLFHSGNIAGWKIHHLDGTKKNGVSIPARDLFTRGYLFVFICKKQKSKKNMCKFTQISSSFILSVICFRIHLQLAKIQFIIQESLRVVSKSSAIGRRR